jgi:hypothetical protein
VKTEQDLGFVADDDIGFVPDAAKPKTRAEKHKEWEREMSGWELADWRFRRLVGDVGTNVGNIATGAVDMAKRVGGYFATLPFDPGAAWEQEKGIVGDVASGMKGALVDTPIQAGRELLSGEVTPGTTSRFITETIPAAAGFKSARAPISTLPGAIKTGATNLATTLSTGASDLTAAAAEKAGLERFTPKSWRPLEEGLSREQVNNLATISRTAGVEITNVAPLVKELMQVWDLDPNLISVGENASKLDLVGDLQRGLPKDEYNALMNRIGKKKAGPLALEIGNGVVDLANRPFKYAIDKFGELPTAQAQTNILGNLDNLIRDTLDPAAKSTYQLIRDRVARDGSTASGLNGVKVWLNKEAAALSNLTPGGVINAQIRPIGAYSDAAGLIRNHLYPQLEDAARRAGQPLDLSTAGRIESEAISFRDGLYKSWYDTAARHAKEADKGRFRRVVEGLNPLTQSKTGMAAAAVRGGMIETPLAEFNRLLKQGIGGVETFEAPAQPSRFTTPQRQLPSPRTGIPPTDTSGVKTTVEPINPMDPRATTTPVRRGRLLEPPPATVAGQPPIEQHVGMEVTPAPPYGPLALPHTSPTGYPETSWPTVYKGESPGVTLRKPAGPGTLITKDPQVLRNMISAITQQLQRVGEGPGMIGPAEATQLKVVQAELMRQLSQITGIK